MRTFLAILCVCTLASASPALAQDPANPSNPEAPSNPRRPVWAVLKYIAVDFTRLPTIDTSATNASPTRGGIYVGVSR